MTPRIILALILVLASAAPGWSAGRVRRLPVKELVEKMKAGWIGQIIGVS